MAVQVPGDIVYNVGLQQEVTARQKVFSDEVLVGPHSDTITHTKRAQNIQDLKEESKHTLQSPPRLNVAEQSVH